MQKEKMMHRSLIPLVLLLVLILAACGALASPEAPEAPPATEAAAATFAPVATEAPESAQAETDLGMGHGRRHGGMMARHHVTVPEPYAGLTNPVPANEASWERGAEQYSLLCASCHGDGGAGDGPAGAALDPAPAPVAHTSQMLGDDLLFWRISEGGAMAPFDSAMPAWKNLDEQARWDLVNYMRALGRGDVQPRQAAGGQAYDPAGEQARHEEMLAAGIDQGVITAEEAELFTLVHDAMDELAAAGGEARVGGMGQMRLSLLADLVAAGTITQEQADGFEDIHTRLEEAGLMQ
jgi:mono/diheme cytochrome c family protein